MAISLKRKVSFSEDETQYVYSKLRKRQEMPNHKLQGSTFEDPILIRCSAVSFQNGPLQLNLYKYTHCGMKYVWDQVKDMVTDIPEPDDSFLFIHHNQNNINEFCRDKLNLFKVSTKHQPLHVPEKAQLSCSLVVCYLDEAFWKDQVVCQSVRDAIKSYIPSSMLFIVENNKPWKKTVEVVRRLKKDIETNQIARPRDVKHMFIEKCYSVLEESISRFISSLASKARTRLTGKHLEELKSLQENISKRLVSKKQLSKTCLHNLRNAKRNGIEGYRFKDGVLQVFITEIPARKRETEESLQMIRKTYDGEVKSFVLKTPFCRPQCSISGGSKLFRDSDARNGTLGMFATMGKDKKIIALSSGHVLNNKMTAIVLQNDTRMKLGPCIWPLVESKYQDTANIPDVAVITVEENMIKVIRLGRLNEKVHLYDDELSKLNHGEVFKYGATSDCTFGFVKPCQQMELFGTDVIMVEPGFGRDYFSLEGDSGAVVLTRFDDKLYAVGVVFGDELKFENENTPENGSVVVSLRKAIERFQSYGKWGEINFDKF